MRASNTRRLICLTHSSAAGRGEVRCELQDVHGVALPGFTLDESVPLTRNSLSAKAMWRGPGSDHSLATLPSAEPIRLRLTMEDAWVYAFHFE